MAEHVKKKPDSSLVLVKKTGQDLFAKVSRSSFQTATNIEY